MADYCKDAEVQSLLTPLSKDEIDTLESLILDGLHVDPGVIAIVDGKRILGDGHNREAICLKHGIAFPTRTKKFPSREAFIQWVIDNQLGRRNLTDERRAYYRGKEYLNTKKSHGDAERFKNPVNSARGNDDHLKKTAEQIGEKHRVSEKTIRDDAAFAEAVDELNPVEKEAVLAGESGQTKKDIAAGAKPVLCRHCEHRQNMGRPLIADCQDCKALRKVVKPKKAKKKTEEPDRYVDDAGTVVPIGLVKYFKTVPLFEQFTAQLNACAKTAKAIEESPARICKPMDPKQHYQKFFRVFKEARKRAKDLRPALLCGKCEDGCEACRFYGFLTSEMADARNGK